MPTNRVQTSDCPSGHYLPDGHTSEATYRKNEVVDLQNTCDREKNQKCKECINVWGARVCEEKPCPVPQSCEEFNDKQNDYDDWLATVCMPWDGNCAGGKGFDLELRTDHRQCQTCDPGYKMEHDKCWAYNSTCQNGTPLRQEERTEYNSQYCDQCNDGYTKEAVFGDTKAPDGTCRPWEGHCDNGKLRAQQLRTADNQCSGCNGGYKLVDQTCFQNCLNIQSIPLNVATN